MATSKKPATKTGTEAPKKRVYKSRAKKVADEVKGAVEDAKEYAEPITTDVKKLFGLRGWQLWAIVGVVALVIAVFFNQTCNKKGVEKNNKKVDGYEVENNRLKEQNDSLQSVLINIDAELKTLYEVADLSTEARKAVQSEGKTIRETQQKITHETTKKLLNPATTDSERDAIAQQILRTRQAAKVYHADTLRQPFTGRSRRQPGGN